MAIADVKRGFYGVQYHPEVNHTEYGLDMLRNFLYEVCHAKGDWTMGDYCRTAIAAIRENTVRMLLTLVPRRREDVERKAVAKVTATSAGGDDTATHTTVRKGKKVGPNDPCPCGSGKKYKKCCYLKDKAAQ